MPKITKEVYDRLCTLINADLNDEGKELLNPQPLTMPSGLKRPLSLAEQIKRIIKADVSFQAFQQGHESFEEADDFDVDDGFETEVNSSIYEVVEEEYIQVPETAHHSDEQEPKKKPAAVETPGDGNSLGNESGNPVPD